MDDSLLQLSAGGIFAFLVIKEVVQIVKLFLDKKKNGNSKVPELSAVATEVSDLKREIKEVRALVADICSRQESCYALHNVRNQDGVPVWYVPSRLETAIAQLADNISKQTDVLRELHHASIDTMAAIKRVEKAQT